MRRGVCLRVIRLNIFGIASQDLVLIYTRLYDFETKPDIYKQLSVQQSHEYGSNCAQFCSATAELAHSVCTHKGFMASNGVLSRALLIKECTKSFKLSLPDGAVKLNKRWHELMPSLVSTNSSKSCSCTL